MEKMMTILGNTNRFIRLVPVDTHDYTVSIEMKFQKNLVKWVKSGHLSITIFDLVRSISSIYSCFYGLPKTHKDNVSLRLILSMIMDNDHFATHVGSLQCLLYLKIPFYFLVL